MERVWGVNLLKANILIALGVRPSLFPAPKPRAFLVGRMIYSSVCSVSFAAPQSYSVLVSVLTCQASNRNTRQPEDVATVPSRFCTAPARSGRAFSVQNLRCIRGILSLRASI